MTFKEQLVIKANEININEEIEQIKEKMEKFSHKRKFKIELIKVHVVMAIGGNSCSNHIDFFIPDNVSPEHYQQLFIDKLIELGFSNEDIVLETEHIKSYDNYMINVKW